MNSISRRDFLKSAALAGAGLSLSACSFTRVKDANSDVRVAVIGFRSQGGGHIKTLSKMKGVRLVAICDVDREVLDAKAKELGGGVATYTDIRRLLDSKEVDAVSIAVPNHWHALATVWACQAGKDVYVEKPASHNIFEGRKMVEAARKYDRIVQTGTQCRSSAGIHAGVQYVQSGKLGRILVARGFCYKARKSIGKHDGPQEVPANIDYNLWCGPAALEPPRRNGNFGPVHYDWHWFWPYGCGDYGNQGPHQVDICRWFLGEPAIAPFSLSVGGRLGYDDDAETPNTMVVYHGYEKAPMIFEVRGLPVSKDSQGQGWKMDNYRGAGVGCVIDCENGYVLVPDYSTAIVFDKQGRQVEKFTGESGGPQGLPGLSADSGGHHGNWIAAVRNRKPDHLNAEILDGHISAGLVHTGNISWRLGAQQNPAAIRERLADNKGLAEAYDRMAQHLGANGVNLDSERLTLGLPLQFDPKAERFVDNPAANSLLTRNYRAPFVVPQKV